MFGSGKNCCNQELAVEVRQGPLRSRACSSGPAGTTGIKSLQLSSGGGHCDQELAVEVWRGRRSERRAGQLT